MGIINPSSAAPGAAAEKFDRGLYDDKIRLEIKNIFNVMANPIKKDDIKEAVTEALESFAGAIKKDFDRVDERFNRVDERFNKVDERINRIETTLIAVVEDLKEARKERQKLEKRINETFNAVDGFTKVVTKLQDEFAIMKEDIKRVKKVIKEKLGVDLL